jgi:TonB family protein
MTPFLFYQLKAGLCLASFVILYYVLFRKETHYRLNRIYLISSLALSFILPLLPFPEIKNLTEGTMTTFLQTVTIYAYNAGKETTVAQEHTSLISTAYSVIALVSGLWIAGQLINMILLIIKRGSVALGNFRIITLPRRSLSYSFFNLIFLSASAKEGESDQVLLHEMAHARQFHSFDIILVQIIKIFQWFNPFVYLAEKALQETHEYLADEAVLEQNSDSGGYRLLLLTQVFGVRPGIFSLFNYSLLKKRLIMMTKQKSPNRNRFKYLVTLPLIMAIVIVLSCTKNPPPPPPPPPPPVPETEKFEQPVADTSKPYTIVDEYAKFQNGSLEAFAGWVQKSVVYPEAAIKSGISGKVMVQFAVNKFGKVADVKVLRSASPTLSEEAIRVIQSSPEWTPAKLDGNSVKQQFVIPVVFALE